MLPTKWWRIAAIAGIGLLAGAAAGQAAGERPPTYVWLFHSMGAEVENLTDAVTEEFEEALVKAGCLPIVQRRNLPDLQSHQKQEERTIGADYLSPRQRRLLSTASADAVVFGKITDDIQGGQVKISVSLETLSGVTLANTSVRISRGKRLDADERERRMADLASEVCGALGFKKNFDDKASPLVVGNVQAKADGSTYIDISIGGAIETVPVTLIIDVPRKEPRFYDYSILFDITNAGSSDLRIVDIFVRTLSWYGLEQIVRYKPLASVAAVRNFLCVIDKAPRQYRANLNPPTSYLRLKPGELETVALMLTALHEGKYSVQVELEYSVGGRTGTSVIGPINDIRFLDHGRIDVLPR
jgi:hypothetical protein